MLFRSPRYLPYVPIVNLYASPNPVVAAGNNTTLYWNASNATGCSATWTGNTATSGQASVGPISAATSYSMTCTGPNGSTSASVNVSIGGTTTAPPPPPTTSALKKGGGAMDWLGLLFLVALAGWSRRGRQVGSPDL